MYVPVDNLGETPIEGGGSSTNSMINLDIGVSVRRQDTVLERVPLGQAFRRFSEEFFPNDTTKRFHKFPESFKFHAKHNVQGFPNKAR